jgi:metallophosphoesterase (TIGR00282 family)
LHILFIGDIVGTPGRRILRDRLPILLAEYPADLVIANGENAAAGLGINAVILNELFSIGIHAVTMGNHTWSKKEIFNFVESEPRMIRPFNVSPFWPGNGYWISRTEPPVLVANLIGQVYMDPSDNPFHALDRELDAWKASSGARIALIDFHAEATAEKIAFARYFDGRVTAVVGTHTHVQTADETILERGTAFITDVGMTGPGDGVIGMDPVSSLRRFVDRLPAAVSTAQGRAMINAVRIEADPATGRALSITRIRFVEEAEIG